LIVSGLPHRNEDKHASEIANLALHFQLSIGNFYSSAMPREKFELRIGIHTGKFNKSINFQYDTVSVL